MNNYIIILILIIPFISYVGSKLIENDNIINKFELTSLFVLSWCLYLNIGRLDMETIEIGIWKDLARIDLNITLVLDSISALVICVLNSIYLINNIGSQKKSSKIQKSFEMLFILSGNLFSLCVLGLLRTMMDYRRNSDRSLASTFNMLSYFVLTLFFIIGLSENLLINEFKKLNEIFISQTSTALLFAALVIMMFGLTQTLIKSIKLKNSIDIFNYGPLSLILFMTLVIARLKPLLLTSVGFHVAWISVVLIVVLVNIMRAFINNKLNERMQYLFFSHILISIIALTILPIGQGLINVTSLIIMYFTLNTICLSKENDVIFERAKVDFANKPYRVFIISLIFLNLLMFPLTQSYFFINNFISSLFTFTDSLAIRLIIYTFYILNIYVLVSTFLKYISFENKTIDWSIKDRTDVVMFIVLFLLSIALIFSNIPIYLSESSSLWSSIYFLDDAISEISTSQQSDNLMILLNIFLMISVFVISWSIIYRKKGDFVIEGLSRLLRKIIGLYDETELIILTTLKLINRPLKSVGIITENIIHITRRSFVDVTDSLSDFFRIWQPKNLGGFLLTFLMVLIAILFSIIKGI